MAPKRWADFSSVQKILVVLGTIIQFTLLGAALWDLRGRDASMVRGPKWLWRGLVFVNWVGPISYFTAGRKS